MLPALKFGSLIVTLENNVHFKIKKHNMIQKELFKIIKESNRLVKKSTETNGQDCESRIEVKYIRKLKSKW